MPGPFLFTVDLIPCISMTYDRNIHAAGANCPVSQRKYFQGR